MPAFFLYGEPPRAPDEATVHVETIAARSRQHGWRIAAHRHADLQQVLIVQRGRADVRLDGGRGVLTGPAVVIVPPGCVHAFGFQAGTRGIVISFAAARVAALAAAADPLRQLLRRGVMASLSPDQVGATDLGALCAMLLREFERSAAGRESVLWALLTALVGNIGRLVEPQGHRDGSPATARQRELVARFREVIERRCREHPPLAEYARALDVSVARLRRACHAVTGQHPGALVQARLLVEAQRQLRYTTMTIAEVGYYLGFEDPAYFTRFFGRLAGQSPSLFRGQRPIP